MADIGKLASANLVVLDIGNTRVGVARWADNFRAAASHLPLEPTESVVDQIQRQWDELPAGPRKAIIASSVNPPALAAIKAGAKAHGLGPFVVVGQEIEAPIAADLPDPDRVGSDRLCLAAAAFAGFKSACVVADFGTAVTIDLVADNGVFLGGTILPGLRLSAKALHEYTAQLPLVTFEAHDNATLGKDTAAAIRNGVFAMMIGALREIAERFATEIGKWPPLVVSGGDAEAIARHCDFVDRLVPDLCLDGVVLAYQQHVSRINE